MIKSERETRKIVEGAINKDPNYVREEVLSTSESLGVKRKDAEKALQEYESEPKGLDFSRALTDTIPRSAQMAQRRGAYTFVSQFNRGKPKSGKLFYKVLFLMHSGIVHGPIRSEIETLSLIQDSGLAKNQIDAEIILKKLLEDDYQLKHPHTFTLEEKTNSQGKRFYQIAEHIGADDVIDY